MFPDLVVNVVVLALVVGGLWLAIQPRYVFVVRIEGGTARVSKGKVTPAFLAEIGRACDEFGTARGWVGGVQRGKRVALAFSRNIPHPCRQRLRNLWILAD